MGPATLAMLLVDAAIVEASRFVISINLSVFVFCTAVSVSGVLQNDPNVIDAFIFSVGLDLNLH